MYIVYLPWDIAYIKQIQNYKQHFEIKLSLNALQISHFQKTPDSIANSNTTDSIFSLSIKRYY